MDNEEKVTQWLLTHKDEKDFLASDIAEELEIPKEEIQRYLILNLFRMINFVFYFDCKCGYHSRCDSIYDVEDNCPQCNRKVNILDEVYIKYRVIKQED